MKKYPGIKLGLAMLLLFYSITALISPKTALAISNSDYSGGLLDGKTFIRNTDSAQITTVTDNSESTTVTLNPRPPGDDYSITDDRLTYTFSEPQTITGYRLKATAPMNVYARVNDVMTVAIASVGKANTSGDYISISPISGVTAVMLYYAGKTTEISEFNVYGPDNEPPTTPSNLKSSVDDTSVNLSWAPSTDNRGVVSYNIYNNETLIGSTTSTNYLVSNLSRPSINNFKIKAVDATNNISEASNVVTISLSEITPPKDTESPTVPSNLASNSIDETTINLSWAPSTDNVGVVSYNIYNDEALIGSTSDTSYIISNLSNSIYKFKIKAVDAANNISGSSNVITIDLRDITPPSTPNLDAYNVDASTVYLSWTPSADNVGVVNYNIYNGESLIGSTSDTNYTVSNLSKTTIYKFKIKAVDAASNISGASNVITIDLNDITPPSTPTNLTYEYVNQNGVKLNWTPSTDASGIRNYIIRVQATNKEYITTETNYVISDLESSTAYSFTVTAADINGNQSQRSAILNVTTNGFTNKLLEVNADLVPTSEGIYNARTYNNGKTYVNVSGFQGDLSQLSEGTDYFQEGQDYWYSTALLSNYFQVQVNNEKVFLTDPSFVHSQTQSLKGLSTKSVTSTGEYTAEDYNAIYSAFYDYQMSHPELDLSEIFDYIDNVRDSDDSNAEQINTLQVTEFSVSATNDGYDTPQDLNDLERQLELENPKKGFDAVVFALYAIAKSREFFNESETIDGNGDAYRHAFWGAMMVLGDGYNWAERYATAHEVGEPNNPADSMAMDLYNNKAGRFIALQYLNQHPEIKRESENIFDSLRSSDLLSEQVLKALDEGQFKRIDKTPVYSYSGGVTSLTVSSSLSANNYTAAAATVSGSATANNAVDPIEYSSKHIRTNSTGKKIDTSAPPSYLYNVATYLNDLNFKNGLGQVDYIGTDKNGNGQIVFKSFIDNDTLGTRTTVNIPVFIAMNKYNTGWYATKDNILAAVSNYFISKQDKSVYSRQVAGRTYGIIYNVDGNAQFNTFGGRNSKYPQDINTFINTVGPQWEMDYMTKTQAQRLYELQQALDMMAFIPVVGVLAEGSNVIISYVNGNTMDAMIRAGFGAAGPVASRIKYLRVAADPLRASLFKSANSKALSLAFAKASDSINQLRSAINYNASNLSSLITKFYFRANGRVELEYAGVGRMSFDNSQLLAENGNQVAQRGYNNYLLANWSESASDIDDAAEAVLASQQSKYRKVGRVKALQPNITYNSNGYNYATDNYGRITKVEGQLILKEAPRNEYAQRSVGRFDRIKGTKDPLDSDDGGHLIASMFNGSGDIDNLVAMNANLNRSGGSWYKLEQEWKKALEGDPTNGIPPKSVQVEIEVIWTGDILRPEAFKVNYKIGSSNWQERLMLNQRY